MATYGNDLTLLTDAESSDTWSEMNTWDVGDDPSEGETDYYIQGASCASTDTNNKTGLASGCVDYGSDLSGSFTNGETVVLIWHVILPGNAMDTFANGGLRAIVGADVSNYGGWIVGGNDAGRNPYGGWQCYAIDPSKTADYTIGSWTPGTSSYRWFGAATNLIAAIAKGTPHGWDAMRYGRGELFCTGATATFADIAQYNDYNDVSNGYNRFGLFQEQGGIYLWKGLLSLGQTGDPVTFDDSNRTIIVDDTPAVYSSFNRIEINDSGSDVSWENISFKALGTTSKGELEVVNNAAVAFDGCAFQNMGTFTFLTGSDVTNCIFNSCEVIDSGGGTFTGTKVLTSDVVTGDSAFDWDIAVDPDGYIDDMTFSKGAKSHHAIDFGTSSPTTMTLRGMTFTDFNAATGQNDSTFYVSRNSGTVTINLVGCQGNATYDSAGATVSLVVDPVTFTVTVKDVVSLANIVGARVLVWPTDGTNYPYQDSVAITGSGTTATVTHNGHGMSTNDNVIISGANEDVYNGAYQITVTGTNTYTYTTNETIGTSPATGTITSTFAFINTTTDGSGQASDSRTLGSDQPITGWVRLTSGSPYYYQQGSVSGTISNTSGLSATVLLVRDQ